MKRAMIVLAVLACATVAQADLTMMFGDNYAGIDLGTERLGPVEVGVTGAVDYFSDQSQPLENFHLTTGDTYFGGFIKMHLTSKDDAIDPYIGFRALSRDLKMDGSGAAEIWEAGVNWFIKDNLGIGLVYQYAEDLEDQDKFLLSFTKRFR